MRLEARHSLVGQIAQGHDQVQELLNSFCNKHFPFILLICKILWLRKYTLFLRQQFVLIEKIDGELCIGVHPPQIQNVPLNYLSRSQFHAMPVKKRINVLQEPFL
ncbi:hypothetical protein FGO68_gene1419 [Halteria grandinella]|uniref:Uncharacterized protein n=1 Tax=Halteria grandinella TaxID=5974 RepID=A0A8J8NGT1_HALGN|nr:hypothetical protein FGO68_gene1419 [Halteria grandinella]